VNTRSSNIELEQTLKKMPFLQKKMCAMAKNYVPLLKFQVCYAYVTEAAVG